MAEQQVPERAYRVAAWVIWAASLAVGTLLVAALFLVGGQGGLGVLGLLIPFGPISMALVIIVTRYAAGGLQLTARFALLAAMLLGVLVFALFLSSAWLILPATFLAFWVFVMMWAPFALVASGREGASGVS